MELELVDVNLKYNKWSIFAQILFKDEVEKLEEFQKTNFSDKTKWRTFLSSCKQDSCTAVKCNDLDKNSRGRAVAEALGFKNAMLQVTCPMLMAFATYAKNCTVLMAKSFGKDVHLITENGFNAIHALIIGYYLKTISKDQVYDLCRIMTKDIFNQEQMYVLLKHQCQIGMTPMELAIYLGFAEFAEVIAYRSKLFIHDVLLDGVFEEVVFDMSQYLISSEESRFYVSPLAILLDRYGTKGSSELRHSNIFKSGIFFKMWINELFRRNVVVYIFFTIERLFVLILYLFYSSPKWTFGTKAPRKMYPVVLNYVLTHAAIVAFITVVLVSALTKNLWCDADINKGVVQVLYSLFRTCVILVMLFHASYVIQLLPFVGKFVISLFSTLKQFGQFAFCFLIFILLFTQIFKSSNAFENNNTNLTIGNHSINSYYSVFLISLNIVSDSLIQSSISSVDYQFVHVIFVLVVPCLFFNFTIGLITIRIDEVMSRQEEDFYLNVLFSTLWSEQILFISGIRKKENNKLLFSICQPVNKMSRSFSGEMEALF